MKNISIPVLLLISSTGLFSQMKPEDTEVWEPVPEIVSPGINNSAPSDAIVLFNGRDLNEWVGEKGDAPKWKIKDGILTVVAETGSIRTKKSFGDCQLHIEWKTPENISGEGQGRGNSGVFLMGKYEIQILDSYNNRTYSNGQAASVYKDKIPLVNACLPPGEWQSYDIIFSAPVFSGKGDLLKPARLSLIHNGILVHNNVEIEGTTSFIGIHKYSPHPEKLPLGLQDHGNPVSFRNIWIREL